MLRKTLLIRRLRLRRMPMMQQIPRKTLLIPTRTGLSGMAAP